MSKKMFLAKCWAKIIFWGRNLSFQSLPKHQNTKIWAVTNMAMSQRSKSGKHTDHLWHFSVPGRPIRGHQWIDLDLSCSEFFFWFPCDSYSVPNDLICVHQFLRFHHFCDFGHFLNFNLGASFGRAGPDPGSEGAHAAQEATAFDVHSWKADVRWSL